MKSILIRLGILALIISALAGCGGDGSTGATGAPGAPGAPGGSLVSVTNLTSAEWLVLKPTIDPASISVTIASPPVVKFRVTDIDGNPLVGLGGQSQSSTAVVPKNYNMFFTLSKLVPVTGGPSKWVNYLVTKPVVTGTTGGVVNGGMTWIGTFPTPDQEGTLVDNGDGTYQYTFLRDVKQSAAIVAGLTDDATHAKADLGDVSYDPTLTHRLGIVIQGSQPGTGTNTPNAVQTTTPVPLVNTFNIGYDFVPAGGAVSTTRDIVKKDSCTECHAGKGIGHVSTASATNGIPPGAFVGRNDPRLCVTCHTDQTKYGFANVVEGTNADGSPALTTPYYRTTFSEAAFTYPRMIHQTHMGDQLVKTGYNLNNHCNTTTKTGLGQCFNNVGLPQDQRNCTKCHTGSATDPNKTADGDNWKSVPSIIACGSCHDGINFATGTGITLADRDADVAAKVAVGTTHSGHAGGAQANDSLCNTCHTALDIPLNHQTNTATAHNPVAGAWLNGKTHTVSTISYDVNSVTVVSGQPVIKFAITVDGAKVTSLPVAPVVTNAKTGVVVVDPNFEPIPGFAVGPNFYAAFSVPQDGIAAPADFNASVSASLSNLLVASGSPKAGSITGPDANGYFTATLTGDPAGQPVTATCPQATNTLTGYCVNPSPIAIPATAKMVTGAMIGTFTQKNVPDYPYTAANVLVNPNTAASGGVIVKSMLKKLVATGYTARRVITDVSKCNGCHDQLGTSPEFHGGARNDPTACNICHNANRVNNGWSVNSSTYVHGIHARDKRTTAFTWNRDWSTLLYPGVIKKCTQCHVDNAVNFGATGTTVGPNLMWPTTATGAPNAATIGLNKIPTISPYVTAGYNYGNGYTFTAEGAVVPAYTPSNGSGGAGTTVPAHIAGAGGEIVPAQNTTLLSSPIASACYSCHDTSLAQSHMEGNGGAIYRTRASQSDAGGNLVNKETCLVCHGVGRVADVAAIHQ